MGTTSTSLSGLTARETQVLALIADGYSSPQIANVLAVEIATVRKHRENLMRKLDLHNVAEVVLYAIGLGFEEPRRAINSKPAKKRSVAARGRSNP